MKSRRSFLHHSALGLATASSLPSVFAEKTKAEIDAIVAAALKAESPSKDNPYSDAELRSGPPEAIAPGAFTIVVLPDTQNYCTSFPEGFHAQTEWIVKEKQNRSIACVLHLGDVTNNNSEKEWQVAQAAMNRLKGQVPFFMVPGNHDYGPSGNGSVRESLLNRFFPTSLFKSEPTFGGTYDKEPDSMENSFHLFSAGGRSFLVLCLEFGPRKDVVRWANEVVAKHKDKEAILITHAYTYFDNTRYDWKKYGREQLWNPHDYGLAKKSDQDVSDGEELWQHLVSKHENFILTLNGHVLADGLGRLTSKTQGGRDVHQMMVNFQMRPKGGDGWLRLLEFRPDRTIKVIDYSPTRNESNHAAENAFTLRG